MHMLQEHQIDIIDPSELLRPEASFSLSKFRDYSIDSNNPLKERVRKTYRLMHLNQTVDFVKKCRNKWLQFNTTKATIRQALEKLNNLIDDSDPDITLPNIIHAFQAAESARFDFPDLDWLHLTALIHDLGKIMIFYNEPQWAVVGDTYPVGCLWANSIVYRDTSFEGNADAENPLYNTLYGIYKPNCGIDNLIMTWGHDEYFYQVLKHNRTKLPDIACKIIRYHSFYPWHYGDDYQYLMAADDEKIKKWILIFNHYDLYTKSDKIPNVDALWPYYESLIEKYIPGILEF